MLVIGHKGAPAYEPENTLRGFAKALELGADMLELDVFVLATGQLMVAHDRHLDRTTNGHGLLVHHSYRELRKLDAGKGELIPTLQEVLDMVDRRVPLIIELKNTGASIAVADVLDDYITNHGWKPEQFIVSSFYHPELLSFRMQHAPHIPIAATTAVLPLNGAAFTESLQAQYLTPDIDFTDQSLVEDAHKRGLKVFVYTISSYEDTLLMRHLGVDGIITDAPDVSLAALASAERAGIRQE
jgi:glycerophosphoryl diester phosphodiesterase